MPDQVCAPCLWLEFDEDGQIDAEAATRLSSLLDAPGITDLVVMAHGWKYDRRDATKLYGPLWAHTRNSLPAGMAEQIIVAGVMWPAKAFKTDFDEAVLTAAHTSNTLVAPGSAAVHDLSEHEFEALLAEFSSTVEAGGTATIAAARIAAKGLTASASEMLIREGAAAVSIGAESLDTELTQDAAPVAQANSDRTDAQLLLAKLAQPLLLSPSVGRGMGIDSVVQGLIAGPRAAVGRFLNQLTYYEMKRRAGVVGGGLANAVLAKLTPTRPVRLHLLGHSFGGRLVTASANQFAPSGNVELFSLTILQGAFSHNALARQIKSHVAGAFSSVVGKLTGPIVITHTHNDHACTIAYALASRLSRDITTGIGDANDEFGAMGANGPQKLDPIVLEPDDKALAFEPKRRKVNTFLADEFIVKIPDVDAHNNVANSAVGRLFAKTILA